MTERDVETIASVSEYERSGDTEEVELQLRWTINSDADDTDDGPDV